MPSIAGSRSSPSSDQKPEIGNTTPQKRRLRSDSARIRNTHISDSIPLPVQTSPLKLKSPRLCSNDSPNSPRKVIEKSLTESRQSPAKKRLSDGFLDKPAWDPIDLRQLSAVKEALHVSTAPTSVVCREDEQNRILQFCKECVELEKSGSLYVCGCPGTGKTLSMEKVKEAIINWAEETVIQPPDTLSINCTSLTNASEIFEKIVGRNQLQRKAKGSMLALQHLRNLYSQKQQIPSTRMVLIIVDELDYLITKDRAVLHDLFMLTTMPFSRCILIGIANAIDLADRFLPKLQSLNCKPMVITFRAYSKDQIITILKQRLMALPYAVFQPQALELCARKVAAASGDMRKALSICRSAIEMLEAEIGDSISKLKLPSLESNDHQISAACSTLPKPAINIVRVDHVANALSKAYRSPEVDTIQALPQHQQIILCSAVKLFRGGKKDTTVGELNKSYSDVCKSNLIPPAGIVEFSNMCRVLGDQGILKLGQSREDKLRKVALKIDETVVTFALQITCEIREMAMEVDLDVGSGTIGE